jgi:hypothetical protein
MSLRPNGTTNNYGTEALGVYTARSAPRLKDMVESTTHQYFVDSSPKVYFQGYQHKRSH